MEDNEEERVYEDGLYGKKVETPLDAPLEPTPSSEDVKHMLLGELAEKMKMPPPYEGGGESRNITMGKGLRQSRNYDISPIELAIINHFLFDTYSEPNIEGTKVLNYGHVGAEGSLKYGGAFDHSGGWWFNVNVDGMRGKLFIQTLAFMDSYDKYHTMLNITSEEEITHESFDEIFKGIKKIAFNNSRFKGQCLEVVIDRGSFQGIKIVPVNNVIGDLVLNREQKRFISHFINRVRRGNTARVMFNGVPGTGKTESIRKIIQELTPDSTFIIPIFSTVSDLKMILESCEIFEGGVVIMDDIDLYVGSRDTGGGSANLLGEFLSFFDGVKKRKINLLASTNDKGLVDRAAERPGRFSFIIDFDYLEEEQVIEICKLHLDVQWQVQDVYDVLTGNIDGKPVKITGAFIANLSDNIKEMALDSLEEGDEVWALEDTLALIESSYKGFYQSQTRKEKKLGFQFGN